MSRKPKLVLCGIQPYVCICGGCLGGSAGCWSRLEPGVLQQSLSVVTAVELQATTEPHCSRGVQPGGICVHVGTARADSRRSGAGLAPRPQALPVPAAALELPLWFYIYNNPLALRSVDRCSMTRDASAHTAAGGCLTDRTIMPALPMPYNGGRIGSASPRTFSPDEGRGAYAK
jgi:hypothetical protein